MAATVSTVKRFWRPLTPLLVILVNIVRESTANEICSGCVWCAAQLPAEPAAVTRVFYQYSPNSGLCVEVEPAGCVPATNCSFLHLDECYRVCRDGKKSKGACTGTAYGCCSDGVTIREGEGGCPEETAMQGEGGSRGVHWGLVLSSVCGAVLLLGLVAIVAMSVYAYRQRHRKSHRWYIHEVLQMYEGGDDSSDSGAASDSSWDDPEHKNLFDHL